MRKIFLIMVLIAALSSCETVTSLTKTVSSIADSAGTLAGSIFNSNENSSDTNESAGPTGGSTGGGTGTTTAQTKPSTGGTRTILDLATREWVLLEGARFIDALYKSPPKTPTNFDCSGFVSYLYAENAGMNLPTASSAYINR
jgi:cell wall-associated NlpC family hydrolase